MRELLMKFAFCISLLMIFGCTKIDETKLSAPQNRDVNASAVHEKSDVFALIIARVKKIFSATKDVTPFCQVVIASSPTKDDYIRNWQPSGETPFCPGSPSVDSCRKKEDDAFEQGLLCYQAGS